VNNNFGRSCLRGTSGIASATCESITHIEWLANKLLPKRRVTPSYYDDTTGTVTTVHGDASVIGDKLV